MCIRGDPDQFRVSDGITWGLGTTFPSRSQFRALLEWNGECVIKDNTEVIGAPFVATDGSVAPTLSRIFDPTTFKFGGVWQAKSGLFVHAGGNYSPGTQGRVVDGIDIDHSAVGPRSSYRHPSRCDAAASARAPHQGDDDRHEHDRQSPWRRRRRQRRAANRPPTVRITCDPSAGRAWTDVAMRGAGHGSGRRAADLSVDGAAGSCQPDRRAEHDVHGAADGRSGHRDRDRNRQREERRHRRQRRCSCSGGR